MAIRKRSPARTPRRSPDHPPGLLPGHRRVLDHGHATAPRPLTYKSALLGAESCNLQRPGIRENPQDHWADRVICTGFPILQVAALRSPSDHNLQGSIDTQTDTPRGRLSYWRKRRRRASRSVIGNASGPAQQLEPLLRLLNPVLDGLTGILMPRRTGGRRPRPFQPPLFLRRASQTSRGPGGFTTTPDTVPSPLAS